MPPAKWRDWYPHKIDKWRGSLAVQGMSDGAYRGYHNLLMSQWQSFDGKLPITDKELARLSGLFSRWNEFKEEIMENFIEEEEGDRLLNVVQYAEWQRAKQISEKKGRKIPESGESLDFYDQSEDAEWTHAGVNVSVPVFVEDKLPLENTSKENKPELWIRLWNENRGILPEVRKITKDTSKEILSRAKEYSDEEFTEAVQMCSLLPFLRGENDRKWKASLGWLLHGKTSRNDGSIIGQVLNGKYGERPARQPEYEIIEVSAERWWKKDLADVAL
jgi:hypothetical protein